jgi:hypothetical protein
MTAMNAATATTPAEAEPSVKPKVITVHGVCPGQWQETARRVLTPHFDYFAVEYRQYNCMRGGALKAVAHPLILVAGLAVAVWVPFSNAATWWGAAAFGLVLAAAIVAHLQRRSCAHRLKVVISEESANSYSTHVIAHSFGTYIVGRTMMAYDTQFERVLLVGCVLPCRFAWRTVLNRRPPPDPQFARYVPGPDIRNEVGMSDMVARLAGATGWLSRELGRAGERGFISSDGLVHTTTGPWDAHRSPTALIHNVPLEKYGHSEWALGSRHMLDLWLPYLWGFPPQSFMNWRIVCSKATAQLNAKNIEGYTDAIALLLRMEWPWTSRPDGTVRTLDRCLRDKIGGDADHQAAIVGKVMSLLVHGVQIAQHAAVSPDAEANDERDSAAAARARLADEKLRVRLNPQLAIDYSIADVLTSAS